MNKIIKPIGIGLLVGVGFFLLFGIVTALVPTHWYKRMILPTEWDYTVLILTSLLIGAYVGLSIYKKNIDNKCNYVATSGGIFGTFAFGCPICSTLLVSLFGINALMVYFNPYRPFLGLLSIGLLSLVVIFKIKDIKK